MTGSGRWMAIADPKGEYASLAEHLGLTTVKLSPGGTATITATSEGQSGSATVTVGASGVRTITVTPSSASVNPFGGTVALELEVVS